MGTNFRRLGPGTAIGGALALVACSSSRGAPAPSSHGSGSTTGTVGGVSFSAQDAASWVQYPDSGALPAAYAGVLLTNFKDACGQVFSGSQPSTAELIEITVPGADVKTFPIDRLKVSLLHRAQWGSACYEKATVTDVAQTGTVTFTVLSSTMVQGSFDATFLSGERMTGTFTAPSCNALAPSTPGC